jgi:hypothetical protein
MADHSAPYHVTRETTSETASEDGLIRGLGLLDATTLVAGSMIGSGIFIVSADIARQVGSPGGSSRYGAAEAAPTAEAAGRRAEPLGTRKAYGGALAACGGGEDGRREGDRGHSARATACGGEGQAELHLARLVAKAVSSLTACAMCFAEILVASSISAGLPDPGMSRTPRCTNRTISPATLASASAARTASPSPPSTQWSSTTQSRPLGRPQRVHERGGVDRLHGIGVDHPDLDRVPQLFGGRDPS